MKSSYSRKFTVSIAILAFTACVDNPTPDVGKEYRLFSTAEGAETKGHEKKAAAAAPQVIAKAKPVQKEKKAPVAKKQSGGTPAEIAAGRTSFEQVCALCHGTTGKGDTPMAKALNPHPRNLTLISWQDSVKDEHIFKVIKEGGVAVGLSPMMAPWASSFNDQKIKEIVAFIRSIKEQ